jgi:hypothetical protein
VEDDNLGSKIKLINKGRGINNSEYNAIISACIESQDKGLEPLSNNSINKIKNIINGEWFVFVK